MVWQGETTGERGPAVWAISAVRGGADGLKGCLLLLADAAAIEDASAREQAVAVVPDLASELIIGMRRTVCGKPAIRRLSRVYAYKRLTGCGPARRWCRRPETVPAYSSENYRG